MNQKLFTIGIILLWLTGLWAPTITVYAQNDSAIQIPSRDTVKKTSIPKLRLTKDTLQVQAKKDSVQNADSVNLVLPAQENYAYKNWVNLLIPHPYYSFNGKPLVLMMQERKVIDNDRMFYLLILLIFLYALFRALFTKYHDDFFKVFFRATLRQQQLKEQLIQASLPSLLFNILFLITGGFYLSFVGIYSGVLQKTDFFENLFYCMLALIVIYVGKFLVIKSMGWVLKVDKGADSYIFIVFLINKVIGVFLIPILMLIAFTGDQKYNDTILVMSLFIIGFLFLYRFWASYQVIRNEIKLNIFHFFLYLCAFEIAPLFVIGKLLLKYF